MFKPDMYQKSIYTIDYKKLKGMGIKCLLFDLDNTICPPKEDVVSLELKNLFSSIKKLDIKCIIFSNSINRNKLKKLSKYYEIDYVGMACKPISYSYKKIIKKYKYKNNEICAIGDQLVTDIIGGNLVKITTILVDPISEKDEKITLLNRFIEKRLFKKLYKQGFEKGKYYY